MKNLVALENPKEIKKVFDLFQKKFSNGQIIPTNIGYHGGSWPCNVFWYKQLNIWSYFHKMWRSDRDVYGCIFGIGDPREKRSNNITVEINYDHDHPRKAVAGRFLKSGNQYFIGHSGKVGGSKKGHGKTEFLKYYDPENLVTILLPNRTQEDVIVITSLSDPLMKIKIAEFVHEVANFKKKDNSEVTKGGDSDNKSFIPPYTPEFFGEKQYTIPQNSFVVKTHHGLVVSCLKDELKKLGYPSTNDRFGTLARDLYVPSYYNEAKILFEIKTDVSPTSIYKAIGQLMFHGAWQRETPRRILVVPEKPKEKTVKILATLNIEILHYQLDNQGVTFSQLGRLITKKYE